MIWNKNFVGKEYWDLSKLKCIACTCACVCDTSFHIMQFVWDIPLQHVRSIFVYAFHVREIVNALHAIWGFVRGGREMWNWVIFSIYLTCIGLPNTTFPSPIISRKTNWGLITSLPNMACNTLRVMHAYNFPRRYFIRVVMRIKCTCMYMHFVCVLHEMYVYNFPRRYFVRVVRENHRPKWTIPK